MHHDNMRLRGTYDNGEEQDVQSDSTGSKTIKLRSGKLVDIPNFAELQSDSRDSDSTQSSDLSIQSSHKVHSFNADDTVFEELVQFMRRLLPRTRDDIWKDAASLLRTDGRRHILATITDGEDITALLCNCVVIFSKTHNRSQSILSQKAVKWHLYRATVYIQTKHSKLERTKFEGDKMYFAGILQEYIRFNRYESNSAQSDEVETVRAKVDDLVATEQIIDDLVDDVTKQIERAFEFHRNCNSIQMESS